MSNWLHVAAKQAAENSARRQERDCQLKGLELLRNHQGPLIDKMIVAMSEPLPKRAKSLYDEQYQRLFKGWKTLQIAVGITNGSAHQASFQPVWRVVRMELEASMDAGEEWRSQLCSQWVQSLAMEMEAEQAPPTQEFPEGPWQPGPAAALADPEPPKVTVAALDLAHPKHVRDDLDVIRAFISEASRRDATPSTSHITFAVAMDMAVQWVETACQRAGESAVHADLLDRIFEVASSSPGVACDTVSNALSMATKLRGLPSHVSLRIDAVKMAAQCKLADYRRALDIHDLYTTSGTNHRPPTKRRVLLQELAGTQSAIYDFEQTLTEFQLAQTCVDVDDEAGDFTLTFLNALLADMYSKLATKLHELTGNLKQATAVSKRHHLRAELQACQQEVRVYFNPLTVSETWGSCLDLVHLHEQNAEHLMPCTMNQLDAVAQCFSVLPVWSLKDLRREVGASRNASAKDVSKQLVELLPLVAVVQSHDGARRPAEGSMYLIDISDRRGALYLHSLLDVDEVHKSDVDQLNIELPGSEDGDEAPALEEDSDEMLAPEEGADEQALPTRKGPGKPKLEDSARYGDEFVRFVQNFALSRGQMKMSDHHRVSDALQIFGASTRAVAKKATEAGFPVSHSGIYNMYAAPRQNKDGINYGFRSKCRGIIDARPALMQKTVRQFHVRSSFSSRMVNLATDTMDLCASTGIALVRRYHGDQMATTPLWIPARSHGKVGFIMRRKTAAGIVRPSLEVADHDFPLDARTSLSLSGWVRCELSDAASDARRMKPSQVYVSARPKRYTPTSALTNFHDLLVAIDDDKSDFDHLLLLTDNAHDYSQDSPVIQHILGRLFREKQLCFLGHGSHAPGDSAKNHEIERQWAQPRQGLVGHELGRSVAPTRDALFQQFAHSDPDPQVARENAIIAVTERGMETFAAILSRCSTAGKPWRVNAIQTEGEPDAPVRERLPLIADYEMIVAFHNANGPSHGSLFGTIKGSQNISEIEL